MVEALGGGDYRVRCPRCGWFRYIGPENGGERGAREDARAHAATHRV
jgi:hypothetical protein